MALPNPATLCRNGSRSGIAKDLLFSFFSAEVALVNLIIKFNHLFIGFLKIKNTAIIVFSFYSLSAAAYSLDLHFIMLPKILVFSRPKLYSFFDSKYPSVGAATLVIISKDLSFKMELIEEFNSYLLRLINLNISV